MTKYMVEFNIYTDGDCCVDFEDLDGYLSRYFEYELYEYTVIDHDSYRYKCRRVFDEKTSAVDFLDEFKDRITSRKQYVETELITPMINRCLESFEHSGYGSDFIDGNVECEASIYTIVTNVRKIKTIIYESADDKKPTWDKTKVAFHLTCPYCGVHVSDSESIVFEGPGVFNFCPNCGEDLREDRD